MKQIKRASGVLLHITSLPDEMGWGRFSSEAYAFIDFLCEGGFKCWQVLPFTDCLYGNSPYSAVSSFAINPYFLDLKEYLTDEELSTFGFDKHGDLDKEKEKFNSALEMICNKLVSKTDIASFEKKNSYWLDDYATFKVIKAVYNNLHWNRWPTGLKNRDKVTLERFKLKYQREIDKIKLIQYLLDCQWQKIKKYANDKGIEIFGDLPFYVELDSSDVWSSPKNWQLENGRPKAFAGVPPDYFNKEGQFWGNPLYNYTAMAKNKYDFWQKRIKKLSELFDIVRFDHFVAFTRYWAIPASSQSAINGKWVKGSGSKILKEITDKYPCKLVAEDLGVITKEVTELKDKFNIPGLSVMQFAFDGIGDHMYQPHNYDKNMVAYLGTHDNDTMMGLLSEGDWDKINRFKRYVGMPLEQGNEQLIDNLIWAMYRSSANLIILTAQDILKLGKEARMNVPGVPEGNWTWQLENRMDSGLCNRYRDLANMYGR